MIIMLALKGEEESKQRYNKNNKTPANCERWWETRHLPGLVDFLQEEDPEQ